MVECLWWGDSRSLKGHQVQRLHAERRGGCTVAVKSVKALKTLPVHDGVAEDDDINAID